MQITFKITRRELKCPRNNGIRYLMKTPKMTVHSAIQIEKTNAPTLWKRKMLHHVIKTYIIGFYHRKNIKSYRKRVEKRFLYFMILSH